MDLFEYMRENNKNTESPLAMRLRPETLDEMVGQSHISERTSCFTGQLKLISLAQ